MMTPNDNKPTPQVAEAEQSAGEEAPRTAGAAVDGVTAAEASERMTDQGAKVVGFTGPEPEELARRSSENLEAVTQASTVLARGAQEVSQELLGLARERSRTAMEGLNRLVACRSVQALVAAQSDLLRDNLELAIHTKRRIAPLSVRVADEATRVLQAQADETADRVRPAA